MTNILIADDNASFRRFLKTLITTRPEWTITAEAGDGEEAIRLAKTSCPDIAILDINMPVLNGIHAAKQIAAHCPNVLILAESLHDPEQLFNILRNAGVRGFVSKLDVAHDLVPAVESIINGSTWFQRGDTPFSS